MTLKWDTVFGVVDTNLVLVAHVGGGQWAVTLKWGAVFGVVDANLVLVGAVGNGVVGGGGVSGGAATTAWRCGFVSEVVRRGRGKVRREMTARSLARWLSERVIGFERAAKAFGESECAVRVGFGAALAVAAPDPPFCVSVDGVAAGGEVRRDLEECIRGGRRWRRGHEEGLFVGGGGPTESLNGSNAAGGNDGVRGMADELVDDAGERGSLALGDGGEGVGIKVAERVPRMGMVIAIEGEGGGVPLLGEGVAAGGGCVSPAGAVDLEELGCLGIVLVKGVRADVEECDGAAVLLDSGEPSEPQVGVDSLEGLVESLLGGGGKEKIFGVGDDEGVVGFGDALERARRCVQFGPRDGLFFGDGGGEASELGRPLAIEEASDEGPSANELRGEVGILGEACPVGVNDDVGVVSDEGVEIGASEDVDIVGGNVGSG